MISISGGGGQVLRTALALSMLTKQPFKITNIRENRPKPGLMPQHLACVRSAQEMCKAKTDAQQGQTELTFIPEEYKAKNYNIDIKTAGSITLLCQTVLLPAIFSEKAHTITIQGGTDVNWSMPYDYFANVIIPQYRRFANIDCTLEKRGYYPKGGGIIKLRIKPRMRLDEVTQSIKIIEQGKLQNIKGIAHASKELQQQEVAEKLALSAKQILNVNVDARYYDSLSTGSGITLWAIFSLIQDDIDIRNPIVIGVDRLTERSPEATGTEAAKKLKELIDEGIPVDEHLADNLIPLMGICEGKIKTSRITDHIIDNIRVTEAFMNKKIEIKNNTIIS